MKGIRRTDVVEWTSPGIHKIHGWGKIEDALNNGLSLVYSGEETDATKVLNDANAEVQQILDEYWTTHQ